MIKVYTGKKEIAGLLLEEADFWLADIKLESDNEEQINKLRCARADFFITLAKTYL